MKIIFLVFIGFCCIISSNSRLIEKITDRTLTTETKTGSSPPVRLARQVEDDDTLTGVSKEDNVHSDEFVRSYNRRVRHFFKPTFSNSAPQALIRKPRESQEHPDSSAKNVTSSPVASAISRAQSKPALVKKPIPKYNEMDYDEDFQMKMNRSPVKLVDSGEHEDEDFNLDDYDFDVNHDEFIGRGKPLEPRVKHKQLREHVEPPKPAHRPAVAPEVKIKSKVNIPSLHKPISHKQERSIELPKKVVGEKEDYYDDTTTTIRATTKGNADEDFNDENDESKEYESKLTNARHVRSPWKINAFADKFGEKTSSVMTKLLSILPMFPEVPGKDGVFEYNVKHDSDAWASRGKTSAK